MRLFTCAQPLRIRADTIRWIGMPVLLGLLSAILSLGLVAVNPRISAGQGGSGSGSAFSSALFADQPELFADDGPVKLLVLALNPFGISEGPARSIGKVLQKNLANTEHFSVVGPEEVEAVVERDLKDEVDCRDIACGVLIGKHIGADFVLVGLLHYEDPIFTLQVRMIDVSNNLTDYEEEVRYTDESMGEDLFRLANNISRNSLLEGRVLSTSIRGIVISLGRVNGIKIGDNMVIYKKQVPITNLEGEQIDTQRKNVAIVNVLNVNRNSSEAILTHKTEEPQVGYFAHTYLDPQRQIELVDNTRRELDTGIRLANRIRPLALAPTLVADTERQDWVKAVQEAEKDRKFWFIFGLAGAGATIFVLNDFSNDSSGRLQLAAAAGATGYAAWKWILARRNVNDLLVEGRSKGFVNLDLQPIFSPGLVGLQLSFRF